MCYLKYLGIKLGMDLILKGTLHMHFLVTFLSFLPNDKVAFINFFYFLMRIFDLALWVFLHCKRTALQITILR